MQTGLPGELPAEKSKLSLWGPSRSRVYDFVWGGGEVAPPPTFIPRALAVTIHLSAFRVPAVDWLGRLLHQRKAANQSRTLPVALLQTAEVVINRNSRFSPALLFTGQSRGGTRELRAESQIRDLLRPAPWPPRGALAKLPFHPGSFFSEYLTFKTNMKSLGRG